MCDSNFKARIQRQARSHNVPVEWQPLRFGLERAVIQTPSFHEHLEIHASFRKMKGVHVSQWLSTHGEFEGYVYVMDNDDHRTLRDTLADEAKRQQDWCQRYHDANEEVRKQMACGKGK